MCWTGVGGTENLEARSLLRYSAVELFRVVPDFSV